MKKMKTIVLVSIVIIGIVSVYLLHDYNRSTRVYEKITIAHPSHVGAGLLYVAQDKRFFNKQGLEVTFVPFTAGKDALNAVNEGKSDVAATAETPFVLDVLRDKKIYLLASILNSEGDFEIIARKDRGIFSSRDLDQKKIGVNKGTVGEFILDVFFIHHGLDITKVTKVYLNHEDMANALATGKVDAVITRYPHTVNTQKLLQDNALVFSTEGIYKDLFNLVSQKDFVHGHEDTIKKLLTALIQTEDFILHNPDEAQVIIAQYTNSQKEDLARRWQNYDFLVRLDQATLLVLEEEARWAIKNNFTTNKQNPNFLNVIYVDGLQDVRPEVVTIIH